MHLAEGGKRVGAKGNGARAAGVEPSGGFAGNLRAHRRTDGGKRGLGVGFGIVKIKRAA